MSHHLPADAALGSVRPAAPPPRASGRAMLDAVAFENFAFPARTMLQSIEGFSEMLADERLTLPHETRTAYLGIVRDLSIALSEHAERFIEARPAA